jgi:protein transport protein SEC31
MGVVAELGRLAACAWAPSGSHIVAGTYAGAVDTSFEASSQLELLALDVANSRLVPGPAIPLQEKFASVAWGPATRAHPAGLIAGGLNDGEVRVWDAATLLRPATDAQVRDPERALLYGAAAQNKHIGPVHGLGFNRFVGSLLASGGTDGTVLVWDFAGANPGSPTVQAPGATDRSSFKDEIITVEWNPNVQHILGTGSSSGVIAVWDLKNRKQVISIRNPRGRLRASSLVWSPKIPTQVLAACDEDDGTGAQLWDLRNATQPIITLPHHAKCGILSAAWCPHDSDMILTTSRDGRSTVVSPRTGEVVVELPTTSTWNFGIDWSPRQPGLYMTTSFDGRVTVNSLLTANAAPSVSAETANAVAASFGPDVDGFASGISATSPRTMTAERQIVTMSHPPQWLRRPSAFSFAFGGRAVSVAGGVVRILSPVIDSAASAQLTDASAPADAALTIASPDDPTPLAEFCTRAAADAISGADRMAWEVMALQFQTDSRRKLLKYLGYQPAPAVPGDMSDQVFGIEQSPALTIPVRPAVPAEEAAAIAADDIDAIIDNGKGPTSPSNGIESLSLDGPAPWDTAVGGDSLLDDGMPSGKTTPFAAGGVLTPAREAAVETESTKSYADLDNAGIDQFVKRAVVVGDFESAVDACLYAKRAADALIIAHAGGQLLWQRAQGEYLATAAATGGATVVGAVAGPKNKMDDFIVAAADVNGKDAWKEALAVIVTYVQGEDFAEACSALGQRLLCKDNHAAALMCFICACNTRMVSSVWLRGRPATGNLAAALASRVDRLSALVTKVRIVTAAAALAKREADIGSIRAYDDVTASVLFEFGALFAAHGDVASAVAYLNPLDPNITGVRGTVADMQERLNECVAARQFEMSVGMTSMAGVDEWAQQQGLVTNGEYIRDDYQEKPMYDPQQTYQPPVQHLWNGNGGGHGYDPQRSVPPPPASPSMAPMPPTLSGPPTPPRPGSVFANSGVQRPASTVGYSKTFFPNQPQASAQATSVMPAQHPQDGYSVMAPLPPSPQMPEMPLPPPPPPSIPNGGRNINTYDAMASNGMEAVMPPPVPVQSIAPMMPSMSAMPPLQPPSMNGYGNGTQTSMMPIQQTQTAPPPPPPMSADAPPPMSYHANVTPGAGAKLPASSEVAVAKQRAKPLSSSGVPGGEPRRSPSVSSSLSSVATAGSVPMDKVDVSGVPADQQIIVKSLRGSFQYALTCNSATMYKKKMEDVNKKLGRLLWRLNAREVEPPVVARLMVLANGISKGDYETARSVTATLSKELHWETNRSWLQALNRLIDAVLTGR